MASSSSSHAFSAIEPPGKRREVDTSSRLYDVFINHRGPDVKHTLATQLYSSLQQLGIRAFLDSEEKELGDSFPSAIETAIRSAAVHIAIFSKNYANSPWCLAELVLMLQSRAKIIPVFYGVQPMVLRHITGVYAEAFSDYEKKGRYLEKLKEWKEALQSVSLITGEEFNGDCKNVVSKVHNEVQRSKFKLQVAKYPVGLHNLVQDFEENCLDEFIDDFESQCCVNKEGKGKAQIAGIFGMGGVGKTTLSKELFNRKRSQYGRACFLFDVREASANRELPSLQMKLIKDIFNELNPPKFQNTEEGKSCIGDFIKRSSNLSFLVVLDDIDHVRQLDVFMVMDMLKQSVNSLVIVTTRDVGILVSTGITKGYNLKGMDRDAARELFCSHAFGEPLPASGYDNLVEDFLDGCGGLPLSLQVLGTHVRGRDQNYWRLEVNKVSKMLPWDIQQRLKISFDALDSEEKEIFMDIACFFIDENKNMALRIWDGLGCNAQHALQTLKDKCLVEEIKHWSESILLRMHDHLRDLGREIANELSRPRRIWRRQDLEYLELKGFRAILSKSNWRCFGSTKDRSMDAEITYFIDNSGGRCRSSTSLLWLEIKFYNGKHMTNIPSWIPLKKLQHLRICNGNLDRLWQNNVQEPSLKELKIEDTTLNEFPDLSRMSNHLERVVLTTNSSNTTTNPWGSKRRVVVFDVEELPIEWLSFLDSLTANPWCLKQGKPSYQKVCLFESSSSSLPLQGCKFRGIVALNNRGQSPTIKSPMSSLRKVKLDGQEFVTKVLISGHHYPNLESLHLCDIKKLTEVDLNMVTTLKRLELHHCENLKSVSGICDITNLAELKISACSKLQQLPALSHMSCLKSVSIVECEKLQQITGTEELPALQDMESSMSSLRQIKLEGHELLTKVLINGSHYPNIESLHLCSLQNLIEVDLNIVTTLHSLTLKCCDNLNSVSGICDLRNLVKFEINGCSEIEELPGLSHLSCLKSVSIVDCEKLNEVCVAGLSFLETIQIEICEKLQKIAGIEELPALKDMEISQCGNATIRSSINRLQRVPSEQMIAIGSAAEGAESKLGPHLFSPWIAPEAVIQFEFDEDIAALDLVDRGSLGAIIYCAVVELDIFSSREHRKVVIVVSRSLSCGGEMVFGELFCTTDQEKINLRIKKFPQFLMTTFERHWFICGAITEKAYMVMVKKGEEWKTLNLIKIISDQLFEI